jgi:hypothetical protein
MTYYLEAFCTHTEIPSRGEILTWAEVRQPWFGFAPPGEALSPDELQDRRWDASAVFYDRDDAFTVDIYRAGMPSAISGRDVLLSLVNQFRRSVEQLPASPERDNVLSHLDHSQFVVSVSVPLSQFGEDDRAWGAASLFLDYFVENCGGLVHAEGHGFYDRNGRLVVEVR